MFAAFEDPAPPVVVDFAAAPFWLARGTLRGEYGRERATSTIKAHATARTAVTIGLSGSFKIVFLSRKPDWH